MSSRRITYPAPWTDEDDVLWGTDDDPSVTGKARLFNRDDVRGLLRRADTSSYQETYSDDKDALYVQLFLFNDQQNHAADPIPFKIATSALDKIVSSAIGKPWIVHLDGSKHVRGASDNPADIIKYQKLFAKGEIVAGYRNPDSNNVHVIAKVFPEYVQDVRSGRIPSSPYLSPLVYVKEWRDGEITDAEVLHVQSVDTPGYDPQIAKISGICQGMIRECMTELRALGAAGKLKESQEKAAKEQEQQEEVGWELEDDLDKRW